MAAPDLAAQDMINPFEGFYDHSLMAARGRTSGQPLGRDAMTFRDWGPKAAGAGRHA